MDKLSIFGLVLGIVVAAIPGWSLWQKRNKVDAEWKVDAISFVCGILICGVAIAQGVRGAAEAAAREKAEAEYKNKTDNNIKGVLKIADDARIAAMGTSLLLPGTAKTPAITPPSPPPLPEDAPAEFRKAWEEPKEYKFPTLPDTATLLFLGDMTVYTVDFPLTVIRQGSSDVITLDREPEGLSFTARFCDADGEIVSEIVRNQFSLNPGHFKGMVRPDPSTLSVIDGNDKEVFKLEYLNPRAIRLTGDFYTPGGLRAVVTPIQINMAGLHASIGLAQVGSGKSVIQVDDPGTPNRGSLFRVNSPKGQIADK